MNVYAKSPPDREERAVSVFAPQTVRIRLLSNENLTSLSLQAYGGLRASQQRAFGKITLTVLGNQVHVVDEKDLNFVTPYVNLASRAGRWVDLQRPYKKDTRTVGWLQVTVKDGKLQVVNILPVETYVLGIVEGELGSVNFQPESLKAQIVASRSYVLAKRGRHRAQGYDFCDRPHCQMFNGTDSIHQAYKLAMQASRGEYLAFKGKPIPAFYHDNCGGKTASVSDIWTSPQCSYLQSVDDGDDEVSYCRKAPRANWTFQADRERLRACFYQEGWIPTMEALSALRVIRINGSDRAHQVLVQSSQPRWVSANEFRRVVNRYFGSEVLKSTYFSIAHEKGQFVFSGRGWGHGVGMCQAGAIEMGNQGFSYRDILAHYYPGTKVERLPEPMLATQPRSTNLN